jgi:uncharacterized membrane protein YkoI
MRKRTVAIATAIAAMALAGGGGIAWAISGDDEQPLTGIARDRAVAAALRHTGGGTVAETETGEGGAAYEVEVRLANGRQVEVVLDSSFTVVGEEADDDRDTDSSGED